jgi:CheY-like chemotaxis protein
MVIDDESIVRQVARTTLERFGYSVIVCEDGPSAINLFRTLGDRVSLILLDMSMPAMSGEETFRRLRAIRPDVKVILSSGYNEVEAISRFTGKGLAGFIQKPYTGAQLGETVASVSKQEAGRTG